VLEVLGLPGAPGAEVQLAVVRLLRHRDRRQPQHDPLERRGDRSRVGDVVAQVGAVVYARHDQLGLEVEQPERGEAHAVHGGAVGGEAARAVPELDLLHPERLLEGDAARRRGAVGVGRDHGQLDTGHTEQRAPEHVQAGGCDAVVVGEQNLHCRENSQ
jgi:hypothetical protein